MGYKIEGKVYFTVTELCRKYKVHPQTFRGWLCQGLVKPRYKVGCAWLIAQNHFKAFLKSRTRFGKRL